jgi:periodic tryptophan protein 1
MSMITATAWVPRGFAAPFPTKYTFDEEEFQRIADLAKLQLDDANEDLEEARNQPTEENGEEDVEDEGSDDEAGAKALKSKGRVRPVFLTVVLLILWNLGTRTTTSRNTT